MYDIYDNDFDKAFDEAVDAIERKASVRLIDANALKEVICMDCDNKHLCTESPACDTVQQIELQPTVEPKHGMTKGEYASLVGLHTHSPAFNKDAPLDAEFVKTVEGVKRIVEFTLNGESKHGRWKVLASGNDAICTNCEHYWIPNGDQYDYHYCPYCGAKMDEVEK